jgi:hypothetical protein
MLSLKKVSQACITPKWMVHFAWEWVGLFFSEIMFFAAFFGALFYARQLSVPWLGATPELWPEFTAAWPTSGPVGDQLIGIGKEASTGFYSIIDTWHLPLFNTLILMLSSVTITFAHWAIKYQKRGAFNILASNYGDIRLYLFILSSGRIY